MKVDTRKDLHGGVEDTTALAEYGEYHGYYEKHDRKDDNHHLDILIMEMHGPFTEAVYFSSGVLV